MTLTKTVTLTETAYAKINLALHVRGRREDGYHEIETLFAFVDEGDALAAMPAERDMVTTIGQFAGDIDIMGNIASKALKTLSRDQQLSLTLDKRLPVAAGLGGGSADAGAVFRLVERGYGMPDDWRVRAAKLGADVPACVASTTCIGRGIGTDLEDVENDLAGTPVMLLNPRIPLSTGDVYRAWDGEDRGALPDGSARAVALAGRNDLEQPARSLCPAIAEVLSELRRSEAFLVRMSGSGATCFALFDEHDDLLEAMERLRFARPEWWMLGGLLR